MLYCNINTHNFIVRQKMPVVRACFPACAAAAAAAPWTGAAVASEPSQWTLWTLDTPSVTSSAILLS